MDNDEYRRFCLYYFFKAVFHNPLKYTKKVFLELSQFYNFCGSMYPHMVYQIEKEEYDNTFKKMQNRYTGIFMPYYSYLSVLSFLKDSNLNIRKIRIIWTSSLLFILSKFYLLTLIIFIIMFFYNLILYLKGNNIKNELLFGIIIFIIYMFNFFISLTIASIYTFDVERYIDDQFIYVLLSQFLAIIYIFLILVHIKQKFRINKNFKKNILFTLVLK